VRVSFAGPVSGDGARLRLVFGIATHPGLDHSADLPTNVTVIVEGREQLYSTQGDDKCRVESLVQQPLVPTPPVHDALAVTVGGGRSYRIAARGYCVDPATTLDGSGRLYVNRFDFAGVARFEQDELPAQGASHGP
jgi:hypothetical protein